MFFPLQWHRAAHSFEIHYEIVAKKQKNGFSLWILLLCSQIVQPEMISSAFWMSSKTYEDVAPENALKLIFSLPSERL